MDINKLPGVQTTPAQDMKLAKIGLDLYLGQALKATVLGPVINEEVAININGQNINAKTSHHFTPGELLNVKVINNKDEITLQVLGREGQNPALQKTILQNALLQALPKQALATNLLDSLSQLVDSGKLPPEVNQQIKNILGTITPLAQLPQQFSKAINQSGVFLESHLLNWKPGTPSEVIQNDYKSQYLKLLDSLPAAIKNNPLLAKAISSNLLPALNPEALPNNALQTTNNALQSTNNALQTTNKAITQYTNQSSSPYQAASQYNTTGANYLVNRGNLPLPGSIPQPSHREAIPNLVERAPETIQTVIHEQVSQVLSRITASQINHLNSPDDNKIGFLIMMDIPIKTAEREIDVVPLMIKQRKATATEPVQWSMSFALSLSQLGDLQGTVSLNGNDVNVKINTEKNETVDILNHYQQEMSHLLDELGLRLNDFNIKFGLENNQINTENLHLLDIRI